MKIIVVYESSFGNIQTIAEAIAEGLGEAGDVQVGTVDDVSPELVRDAHLIVAGGPTHAHGMIRPNTRPSIAVGRALERYGAVLPGQQTLRGWLERMPTGRAKAAAFDTRQDAPRWLAGSAAKGTARALRRKGYSFVGAQSFLMNGSSLADGERERAVLWGRELWALLRRSFAA